MSNSKTYANKLPHPPVDTSPPPSDGSDHAGTRPPSDTNCPEVDNSLVAIVPKDGDRHTASAYPSFWFYIPYTVDDVETIDFKLLDNNETQTFHRTSVQLGHTPGILSVTLSPETSDSTSQPNPLDPAIVYRWYLILNCHSDEPADENEIRTNDFEVTGLISRIDANSDHLWDGVGYDELNHIASLYQANPQNRTYKLNWIELLESIELEHLQAEPLLE
ncbi:MAG: DUF928 domain-containing protein [Cyanobacteria bacterium P01_F01_bin.150]